MLKRIETDGLHCLCAGTGRAGRIAYALYPMDIPAGWLEAEAARHAVDIAVVTGMEWQDAMSPWPAAGVPRGTPDFKGEAPEFLQMLQHKILPQAEAALGIADAPERTLVGVSMSGLFALWQWLQCDTFANIASLSGSFWYDGFLDHVKSRPIPHKSGKAYFLLGNQEAATRVKAFKSVAADTAEIVSLLERSGIDTRFDSVPGNHYADPLPRLDRALTALFS